MIINGVLIRFFINGWWGNEEGKNTLNLLQLNNDKIPFNITKFLKQGYTEFKDGTGNVVRLSFRRSETKMHFLCNYNGKRKGIRLFREWGTTDVNMILQLESCAVGECTRNIILEKTPLLK